MEPSERERLLELLESNRVTPATRRVLLERLNAKYQRKFFSESQLEKLQAVALRLVPHDPLELDLVGPIDERLARGDSKGWRYADLPLEANPYAGLLEAFPNDFLQLEGDAQDSVLEGIQKKFPRAFEDLLAELVEIYYAHPLIQVRIGYYGFADAQGWTL